MATDQNTQHNRFFSHSSIFQSNQRKPQEDPTPFGLNLKEPLPQINQAPKQNGATMGPSPTNTPSNSDTCFDLDYEF